MKNLECESYNRQGTHYGEASHALPLTILENLKRPSNQMMTKNDDGSLDGVRYVISTQPSHLRPIKSWTITIETWTCSALADITVKDTLFLRIIKAPKNTGSVVQEVYVHNEKTDLNDHIIFNAVMAAGTIINKIDAGRVPNIEKILSIFNL